MELNTTWTRPIGTYRRPTKFEDMSSLRLLAMALVVALSSSAPLGAFAAGGSPATTWHVSPNGNDASSGGPGAPLGTIEEAFDRASAGDTILLLKGKHASARLKAKSGTAQAPITLAGSSKAVIQATAGQPALALHDLNHIALLDIGVAAGSVGLELVDASSVSIEGLIASDASEHAISIANSSGVVIEHCRILNGAGDGIHATDSTSLMIDRCEISEVRDAAVHLSSTESEIRNNRISNALGGIVSSGATSRAIVTANNLSDVGAKPAVRVDGPARIINNSINRAMGDAIVLGKGAASGGEGTVLHNTTWAVSGVSLRNHALGRVRVENNLGIELPRNRSASRADFLNAATGDLRLSADSLALDSARESEVSTDQRGRARPLGEGPDFGAFESSYTAPRPPDTPKPTAPNPDPEDIPTGLGEPGLIERESPGIDSETRTWDAQLDPDAANREVEPNETRKGAGTRTVEALDGDIALDDSLSHDERGMVDLTVHPEANPPLSYRTLSDDDGPSTAGAIAAGCVVLAGGVGGLAMAVSRRRNQQIEGNDPWQEHDLL